MNNPSLLYITMDRDGTAMVKFKQGMEVVITYYHGLIHPNLDLFGHLKCSGTHGDVIERMVEKSVHEFETD